MTIDPNHPLLARFPRPISWLDWLHKWHAAQSTQEYLAYLHFGFDAVISSPDKFRSEQLAKRVILYLSIADGSLGSRFCRPDESQNSSSTNKEIQESRLEISRKAADVLAKRYFVNTQRYDDQKPSWLLELGIPGVLDAVLHYFRPDDFGGISNFTDLKKDHFSRKIIADFLLGLWLLSWDYPMRRTDDSGWRYVPSEDEVAFKEHLVGLRPKMLNIAEEIGALDRLLTRRYEPDSATIQALRAKALKSRNGEYGSIDEAVMCGYEPARVFRLLQIVLKQRKKHDAIRAKADAARQADLLTKQATQERSAVISKLDAARTLEERAAGLNTMPAV